MLQRSRAWRARDLCDRRRNIAPVSPGRLLEPKTRSKGIRLGFPRVPQVPCSERLGFGDGDPRVWGQRSPNLGKEIPRFGDRDPAAPQQEPRPLLCPPEGSGDAVT